MATSIDPSQFALRVYGNLSLLEMAPVLLAADEIYPGKVTLAHGGVMSLWGRSTDLASLAASGESDLAANSETQALRGTFDHPDLRFIFTVAECPYRIVGRRSAGIGGLADLKGRKVGTMLNSSAEFFLDRMLRTVGLGARDLTVVPFMAKTDTPLTRMPQALRDGALDAVTVWEPQIEQARRAIGEDAIEFSDPALYRERFCLCSTEPKLRDPALRQGIVAFARALMAATERLQREPKYAQALVAQTAELEMEVVERSWGYLTFPGTLAPDLLDALVPVEAWLARQSGRSARSRASLAQLIDDSVLREALLG